MNNNWSLTWFIALSLLLMGIDGATDFVDASSLHPATSIEHADHHFDDAAQAVDDSDHGNHCCHAHVGALSQANSINVLLKIESGFFTKTRFLFNRTQGPPTPPPNA